MNRRGVFTVVSIGITLLMVGRLTLRVYRPIQGHVSDNNGPLAGAIVRVKTTDTKVITDINGMFSLTGFTPDFSVHVTAWKDGYYIGGAKALPWNFTSIDIELSPYTVPDNKEYSWILPAIDSRSKTEEWLIQAGLFLAAQVSFDRAFLPLAERITTGCRDCHGDSIYNQWATSSHALGNANERFMTMYNGTDIYGHQSPPTRYVIHRDYGRIPLRPDMAEPYYGPGFMLDFPDSAGNCATCHLPTSVLLETYGVDPNDVSGVDAQGTHCDYCHKISSVNVNETSGQPYENMTGTLSTELMRPGDENQLFFGPYDDVDVGPDTFLPLMKESEICAACHTASFWGVPIYQSFAEWQASPYPAEGKTCQSCHMTPDGVTTNFAPERGGQERDPEAIPTHNFPGAADETLLQNAVTMDVDTQLDGDKVIVTVNLTNDNTGHHIPTDSPLRQIILFVQVTGLNNKPFTQVDGPVVPEWGGMGETSAGYYGGQPGTAFAKILQEQWTEIFPTGAYWNPTRILSDNRIPAMETDVSTYSFEIHSSSDIRVSVILLFRRAFIDLMDQKGWDVPDIVMAEHSEILVQD